MDGNQVNTMQPTINSFETFNNYNVSNDLQNFTFIKLFMKTDSWGGENSGLSILYPW